MKLDNCKFLQFATSPVRFGIINYEQSNLLIFSCALTDLIQLLIVLNKVLSREDVVSTAISTFGEIENFYIINQTLVESGTFNRYKAFIGSQKVSLMVFRGMLSLCELL